MSGDTSYADAYRDIDFRKYPDKYKIGRGEQGVLIAQPYKDEILPHWKFATPEAAEQSATTIYDMFLEYGRHDDFVGMDMARKFLQMGFTRARRYANHHDGNKYGATNQVKQQAGDWQDSAKAQSAEIFLGYHRKAKDDIQYLKLKALHQALQKKRESEVQDESS